MRFDDLAAQLVCPYCGMGPNYWCVTSSGAAATRLHEGRTAPVRDMWREGFEDGLAEGAHGIRNKLEREGKLPFEVDAAIHAWAKGWGVEGFDG